MTSVVVIGAGIGGLTTAAVLSRAGLDVKVLEAQTYPGGCAGTYFHQGYRFDAGATLAGGFFSGGPMDLLAQAAGIAAWPACPTDTAMLVHLPGAAPVPRLAGQKRWDFIRSAFGPAGIEFFSWQERTANALWDLALRLPPWPPQSFGDFTHAAGTGMQWLLKKNAARLALEAFQPVSAHLASAPDLLRLFVDAQLLISAQTTSEQANALYGAVALDLPRSGVVHLEGGMGAIAETLVAAIRRSGGMVLYRHEVIRVRTAQGKLTGVETKKGEFYPADLVVANLTPWNLIDLLEGQPPSALRRISYEPLQGYGAFMVYAGLDSTSLSPDFPLHHQVIKGRPLGEGNSIFASLSPAWDGSRAPAGHRALTISTHTAMADWWNLFNQDRSAYEARKLAMAEHVLAAAETAIPGLRRSVRLILPATPVTFRRFTGRKWGWVGGIPQTSLFTTLGPRLGRNFFMVGDTIFPGQSTAAVALGGLRVASEILSGIKEAKKTVMLLQRDKNGMEMPRKIQPPDTTLVD